MPTSKNVETFRIGGRVAFKPGDMMHSKYGSNVLDVVAVIPVPANTHMCGCGAPSPDECFCRFEDDERVRQALRQSVGHHQWVVVAMNGRPITDHYGEPQKFSGSWFMSV